MQLYIYIVSQPSEFCCHNPLCCFSTSVCHCLCRYDSVRKLLDTPSYTVWSICNGMSLLRPFARRPIAAVWPRGFVLEAPRSNLVHVTEYPDRFVEVFIDFSSQCWNYTFQVALSVWRLGYGVDDSGSLPGRDIGGIFSLRHWVQIGSGAHPAPIQWVPGALTPMIKWPEADWSPPSSPEVKNSWSYTSTPPKLFHGVVLS